TVSANWGVNDVLESIGVPFEQRYELLPRWSARRLDAVGEVDAELDAAGLGMDHVMAHALRRRLDEIERIDRIAASAEVRRAATLREIAHHRATLAASLRVAADALIEDAEFAVVEAAGAPGAAQPAAEQPAAQAAE